jgi:hypothetical protein
MRRRHLSPSAAVLVPLGALVALAGLTACADEADTTTAGPAPTTVAPDPPPAPRDGAVVEGDGWRGVLLDAGLDWLQLDDGTLVEDVTSFVPSQADVERFEDQLPAALPNATNPSGEPVTADDLDGYVRQYTGVAGGGARHLVVAAICDDQAAGMDWQDGWIEVSDGGACFWDATMDLDTGAILRFYVHGSA